MESTKYHLQDSPDEGWVTIATSPSYRFPIFQDLIRYADKIRDNVRTQPSRVYDGGHRIIVVHEFVAWSATPDKQSYTENPYLSTYRVNK